jgi:hypothetical protein
MTYFARSVCGVAGLFLVACGNKAVRSAASQVPVQTRVALDEDIQCKFQRVTGSNVAIRVCTTRLQREQAEESAREMRTTLSNEAGVNCGAPPGCGQR